MSWCPSQGISPRLFGKSSPTWMLLGLGGHIQPTMIIIQSRRIHHSIHLTLLSTNNSLDEYPIVQYISYLTAQPDARAFVFSAERSSRLKLRHLFTSSPAIIRLAHSTVHSIDDVNLDGSMAIAVLWMFEPRNS
jgi:hypothetical protein